MVQGCRLLQWVHKKADARILPLDYKEPFAIYVISFQWGGVVSPWVVVVVSRNRQTESFKETAHLFPQTDNKVPPYAFNGNKVAHVAIMLSRKRRITIAGSSISDYYIHSPFKFNVQHQPLAQQTAQFCIKHQAWAYLPCAASAYLFEVLYKPQPHA